MKHDGDRPGERRHSRRELFTRAAAGAGPLIAASVAPIADLLPAAWAETTPSDLGLAKFVQGIELAAVAAYTSMLQTGLLDSPAATAIGLFASHHQEHANSFDLTLGDQRVTDPNAQVLSVYLIPMETAADQTAVLEAALKIEETTASTHLFGLGQIGIGGAKLLAAILPVESQHAAELGTLLRKPAAEYLPSVLNTAAALHPAG